MARVIKRATTLVTQETKMEKEKSITALERHYKTKELAEIWQVSEDTVLRWSRFEPGVLLIGEPSTRRRCRVEVRIPESVAIALHERRTRGRKR